jgi:hypothetical protein
MRKRIIEFVESGRFEQGVERGFLWAEKPIWIGVGFAAAYFLIVGLLNWWRKP